MFKRLLLALAMATLPAAPALASALPAEPANFTMEVAMTTALQHNPSITAAQARLTQAKLDEQTAQLWWARAINANANYVVGNPYGGYTPNITATGLALPTAAAPADVALEAKWVLPGLPAPLPALAVLGLADVTPASAVVPTGLLLADFALPLDLGLSVNVGPSYAGGHVVVPYAVSLGHDLTSALAGYAEVSGTVDPLGAANQNGVDLGLQYLLDPDTRVMGAVYTDVAAPFGTWYVTTNWSHRWGSY